MCETLHGAAVRRMQSEALVNCAPLTRAKGYPETPLDPPRQPVRLDELAMWRRYRQRRCYPWPRAQPRKHGHRCRDQWTGHRACAHDAGGLGPDQRPPGAAVPGIDAAIEDLLGGLSESNRGCAEDRDLPRLAAGRSCGGFASAETTCSGASL